MRTSVIVAVALLQGCVVVPRTTESYDEQCNLYTRQMTLDTAYIGAIGHCHGRDCAYALAALGVVAAASAVVSGTIMIAGNVVYWVEKQGKCAIS